MHSTNYKNTFIEIAEDCDLKAAKIPLAKNDKPTIAQMQYARLSAEPYRWTSDDLIFGIWAERNEQSPTPEMREEFFSKGQACLRASPLPKTHGFGVHFDENERVAIYPVESGEYQNLQNDPSLKHLKAMRSKRAG